MGIERDPAAERIVTASLPSDVARAIREAARRDDRTTSAYVRRILIRHVRELTGAGAER